MHEDGVCGGRRRVERDDDGNPVPDHVAHKAHPLAFLVQEFEVVQPDLGVVPFPSTAGVPGHGFRTAWESTG